MRGRSGSDIVEVVAGEVDLCRREGVGRTEDGGTGWVSVEGMAETGCWCGRRQGLRVEWRKYSSSDWDVAVVLCVRALGALGTDLARDGGPVGVTGGMCNVDTAGTRGWTRNKDKNTSGPGSGFGVDSH